MSVKHLFTKVDEMVYREHKDGTKDIGVKYAYSGLSLPEILKMAEKNGIRYVDVSVDDEYPYGQGRHSFEYFRQIYEDLSSIESVSFPLDEKKLRIVVFPDNKTAWLNFRDVKETPALDLNQIFRSDA